MNDKSMGPEDLEALQRSLEQMAEVARHAAASAALYLNELTAGTIRASARIRLLHDVHQEHRRN